MTYMWIYMYNNRNCTLPGPRDLSKPCVHGCAASLLLCILYMYMYIHVIPYSFVTTLHTCTHVHVLSSYVQCHCTLTLLLIC